MARLSNQFKAVVTPGWQGLIQTVFGAHGSVAKAARLLHPKDEARRVYFAKRLQTVTNEAAGQPRPAMVWQVAAAARILGNKWAAGPLFLFAAGHYREFSRVMILAGHYTPMTAVKLKALVMATTACELMMDWRERRNLETELHRLGKEINAEKRRTGVLPRTIDDYVYLRRRIEDLDKPRDDRDAWAKLLHGEMLAFEKAWDDVGSGKRVGSDYRLVVIQLAEESPEIGLEMQRQIVCANLFSYLGGPMKG